MLRVWGLGFWVWGLGFVGLGFRVWGVGFGGISGKNPFASNHDALERP